MPRVVIIGAGIVGASLADELTARGWTDVTVARPGPAVRHRRLHLARARAGLPDQPVEDHDRVRAYTVEKFGALDIRTAGRSTAGRRARGRHHAGAARPICTAGRLGRPSWGIEARAARPGRMRRAAPAARRRPHPRRLHVPTDGLAKAVRAVEAQARRASARGAPFLPGTRGPRDPVDDGGRVTGVGHRPTASIAADIVVCCAGFWGPQLAGRSA